MIPKLIRFIDGTRSSRSAANTRYEILLWKNLNATTNTNDAIFFWMFMLECLPWSWPSFVTTVHATSVIEVSCSGND